MSDVNSYKIDFKRDREAFHDTHKNESKLWSASVNLNIVFLLVKRHFDTYDFYVPIKRSVHRTSLPTSVYTCVFLTFYTRFLRHLQLNLIKTEDFKSPFICFFYFTATFSYRWFCFILLLQVYVPHFSSITHFNASIPPFFVVYYSIQNELK